jgi:hypothetical protein
MAIWDTLRRSSDQQYERMATQPRWAKVLSVVGAGATGAVLMALW